MAAAASLLRLQLLDAEGGTSFDRVLNGPTSVLEVEALALAASGWPAVQLSDADGLMSISSDSQLTLLLTSEKARNAMRERDELEAKMCRLSSLLGCCQPNEAFLGCNALWEAALDERAAAMLNSAHFELLLRHLWSPETRVRHAAVAALWSLHAASQTRLQPNAHDGTLDDSHGGSPCSSTHPSQAQSPRPSPRSHVAPRFSPPRTCKTPVECGDASTNATTSASSPVLPAHSTLMRLCPLTSPNFVHAVKSLIASVEAVAPALTSAEPFNLPPISSPFSADHGARGAESAAARLGAERGGSDASDDDDTPDPPPFLQAAASSRAELVAAASALSRDPDDVAAWPLHTLANFMSQDSARAAFVEVTGGARLLPLLHATAPAVRAAAGALLLEVCLASKEACNMMLAPGAATRLVDMAVGASPGLESAPDRRHAAELLHVCLARNNLVACRNSCNAPVGGKTPTSSQATESDARERVQATLSACIVSAEASLACLPWLLSRLLAFVKAINRYVSLDSLDPQSMALVSATMRCAWGAASTLRDAGLTEPPTASRLALLELLTARVPPRRPYSSVTTPNSFDVRGEKTAASLHSRIVSPRRASSSLSLRAWRDREAISVAAFGVLACLRMHGAVAGPAPSRAQEGSPTSKAMGRVLGRAKQVAPKDSPSGAAEAGVGVRSGCTSSPNSVAGASPRSADRGEGTAAAAADEERAVAAKIIAAAEARDEKANKEAETALATLAAAVDATGVTAISDADTVGGVGQRREKSPLKHDGAAPFISAASSTSSARIRQRCTIASPSMAEALRREKAGGVIVTGFLGRRARKRVEYLRSVVDAATEAHIAARRRTRRSLNSANAAAAAPPPPLIPPVELIFTKEDKMQAITASARGRMLRRLARATLEQLEMLLVSGSHARESGTGDDEDHPSCQLPHDARFTQLRISALAENASGAILNLASSSAPAARELVDAGAPSRLLVCVRSIQREAVESSTPLRGHVSTIHERLLAAVACLVSRPASRFANDPVDRNTTPAHDAVAVDAWKATHPGRERISSMIIESFPFRDLSFPGFDTIYPEADIISLHGAAKALRLSEVDLEVLIHAVLIGRGGARASAAATLWMQACAGGSTTLGELGAMPALASAINPFETLTPSGLNRAIRLGYLPDGFSHPDVLSETVRMVGDFSAGPPDEVLGASGTGGTSPSGIRAATWAAAAMWVLCEVPSNAAAAAVHATRPLLRWLTQSHHDAPRLCALGCLCSMLRHPSLIKPMLAARVPLAVLRLAVNPDRPIHQRLDAIMALDALAPQLDVHGLPPGALALPLPHTAGDASEISGDGSDGEITHLVEADTELAPFLLSLLGDEQPTVIRALACRALARCAYRGGRWREAVVEAGGCRILMATLHSVISGHSTRKAARSSTAYSETSPRMGPTMTGAQHLEDEGCLDILIRDALIASLNLSETPSAKVEMAKHGLPTLVSLLVSSGGDDTRPGNAGIKESPSVERSSREEVHLDEACNAGELGTDVLSMASAILKNLSQHPGNRTRMYQAELQIKVVAAGGKPVTSISRAAAAKGANADCAGALPTDVGANQDNTPPPKTSDVTPATAPSVLSSPDQASAAISRTKGTSKEAYLDWVSGPLQESIDKREQGVATVERKSRKIIEAETRAREAFWRMDEFGGEILTREEVIRAFRLNPAVREKLLPLLPPPPTAPNTVTSALDLPAQCRIFEAAFERMDLEGTDEVDIDDFVAYFSTLKFRQRKASALPPVLAKYTPKQIATPNRKTIHETATQPLPRGEGALNARQHGSTAAKYRVIGGASPNRTITGKAIEGGKTPLNRLFNKAYADTWAVGGPTISSNDQAAHHPQLPSPTKRGVALPSHIQPPSGILTGKMATVGPSRQRVGNDLDRQPFGEAGARLDASNGSLPGVVHDPWRPQVEQVFVALGDRRHETKHGKGQPPSGKWNGGPPCAAPPAGFKVVTTADEKLSSFKFGHGEGVHGKTRKASLEYDDLANEVAREVDRARRGQSSRLIAWEGTPGSKIGEGFGSYEIEPGKVIRFYLDSHKRNARAPSDEPPPTAAISLAALRLDALPALPSPPALITRMRIRPPVVVENRVLSHLAPFESWSRLVTGATPTHAVLRLRRSQDSQVAPVEIGVVRGRSSERADGSIPLSSECVFAERRSASDGRSLLDECDAAERAFHIDWARANVERFRNDLRQELAAADCDTSVSAEINDIKEEMLNGVGSLLAIYGYYCATERAHDGFVLSHRGFMTLCNGACLSDGKESLQLLFSGSNHTTDNHGKMPPTCEQRLRDGLHLNGVLLRFEFLRAFIRLAVRRYLVAGCADPAPNLAVAVRRLLGTLTARIPEDGLVLLCEPDRFRREKLYRPDTAALLDMYAPQLRLVFSAYSIEPELGDDLDEQSALAIAAARAAGAAAGISGAAAAAAAAATSALEKRRTTLSSLMSLEEWLKFVAATNMLYEGVGITPGDTSMYSASAELHPPDRDGLTSDTASLLFVASRTFVTDELRSREMLTNLTFVDFVEAVARLSVYKVLPSPQTLLTAECDRACHFFEQARAGLLEPGVHPALHRNDEPFMIGRPGPEVPLGEVLEVFLPWLLETFGFQFPKDNPPVPPSRFPTSYPS